MTELFHLSAFILSWCRFCPKLPVTFCNVSVLVVERFYFYSLLSVLFVWFLFVSACFFTSVCVSGGLFFTMRQTKKNRAWARFFVRVVFYTLKRKCRTSPSLTMYSLPSRRHLPASFAPASPLYWMKSSYATTSARIKPFSKSV